MEHPWINGVITNENDLDMAKAELKKYNALRKLKVIRLKVRKVELLLLLLTDSERHSSN